MTALNIKLFREIRHLRGQLIAIILVIASGIASFVMMRSMYSSLLLTLTSYYETARFADVFVSARRVPETIGPQLAEIDGVAAMETRTVVDVMVDVPGLKEPASATVVSIPEDRRPSLNDLHMMSGTWVRPGHEHDVILSAAFAEANHLSQGDQISVVINGKWKALQITGVAISPEYIIEVSPGSIMIDNKRYGVMWMGREALSAAYDMKGAFNSAVFSLYPGASVNTVREKIDVILKQYGSMGAIGRTDQLSHRLISDEIRQNEVSALYIPIIFFSVAVFLLNIALVRLVSTQRMYVAILKAFGYSNLSIALHYIGFAVVAVLGGTVLGMILGYYFGVQMTGLYTRFYRFPVLRFTMPEGVLALSVVVSLLAAVLGASSAVRSAVLLPPAEAMRPDSPKAFKSGILDRFAFMRFVSPITHMIMRNIERRPVKSSISIVMIALATAILIVGRFMFDAIDGVIDTQFNRSQRDDAALTFRQPLSSPAAFDLLRLPGVMRVECFRMVGVDLRNGQYMKRGAITGLPHDRDLRRVVDEHNRSIDIPDHGLLLTSFLARQLHARVGDSIDVGLLEQDRRTVRLPITAVVDEIMGVQVYMRNDELWKLVREDGTISGAYLQVDHTKLGDFYARVKQTPAIAGVMVRETALRSFNETYSENMWISTTAIVFFAVVIAFGVVYNSARIALSERGNELASLRVLGLTRGEITVILLGEQVALTMAGIPVGVAIGYALCAWLPTAFETDIFRIPFSFTLRNVGLAMVVILSVTIVTGVMIRRRLNTLDLVAVLKSRE